MTVAELLKSGLLEMYCLGDISERDKILVENFALHEPLVRKEISAIEKSFEIYSETHAKKPPAQLKNKIIEAIMQQEADKLGLPPLLTAETNSDDWFNYLHDNDIHPPNYFKQLYMYELPSTQNLITYVAWARKGAFVEEIHERESEKLLMLKGTCIIRFNKKEYHLKENDFIEIPANTMHHAEATSDEIMILIGQRIAA